MKEATTPEGPELHSSADILRKRLVGNVLVNAFSVGGRYAQDGADPAGYSEFIRDMRAYRPTGPLMRVSAVSVKGKFMWWELDSGWSVWTTYGMSGQWVFGNANDVPKHAAFYFYVSRPDSVTDSGLTVDDTLYFVDPRHFGTIKFSRDPRELERKLRTIGPDMLDWSMTEYDHASEDFATLLRCKAADRTVAEALMDQRIVSGVGNYVKCEALYRAGVSPWSLCRHVSWSALERLHGAVIDVMRESYGLGGASLRTYSGVDGSRGEFANMMRVYGRRTDPEGREVVRETTPDGRTTHWVPSVQSTEHCTDPRELNTDVGRV